MEFLMNPLNGFMRNSIKESPKTTSKPENLNADQWLQGGSKLPRQEIFVPLEHNLLRMMAHTVFTATATAFADTTHIKNQNDKAKTCIAHTAFASNKAKLANRKREEEPKQQPGLETSTRHYFNVEDSDELIVEKKVEYVLYAKSELMMPIPAIRLTSIHGPYPRSRVVCSTKLQRIMS